MIAHGLNPILNVSDIQQSFHIRHPDGHVFRIGRGVEETEGETE